MPLALILSSHVAGSRVGGYLQALALNHFGVEPVLVPTVLFGRHPGWGAPGGGKVEATVMAGMLQGIAANGLYAHVNVVICGYFADAAQVETAALAIAEARTANPDVVVLVDPILGDADKGLYVKPEVAEAVKARLLPLADILTPNAFELGWLSGRSGLDDRAALTAAAGALPPATVIVTSPPAPAGETGALLVHRGAASLLLHPKLAEAPKGTGDLMVALLAARVIKGDAMEEALTRALDGVVEALECAKDWGSPEIPIASLAPRLTQPPARTRIAEA
ncbi:MAG: PfkB family carbohydrate kinase [Pseudomonadota bacterium]|jgi:pyridoxine kinase